MSDNTTETSVLISLAELAGLERERQEEEEREEAAEQARREQVEALARARSLAEEEHRREQEALAREAKRRDAAEQAVRLAAIREGELEAARIAARAKSQLELATAQQRHERELSAIRLAGRRVRMRWGAMVGAAMLVLAGGAATATAFVVDSPQGRAPSAAVTQYNVQTQRILTQRLVALDGFHNRLQEGVGELETVPTAVSDASQRAATARKAVDPLALDDAALDTFEHALSDFGARMGHAKRAARLAELDALSGKLDERYAAVRRPGKALRGARASAHEARRALDGSAPDDTKLAALQKSLTKLELALEDAPVPRAPVASKSSTTTPNPGRTGCHPKDPMCFDLP